jgi:leukotriene A-4 hydrolase/aminopeptidase
MHSNESLILENAGEFAQTEMAHAKDFHSFSNPESARVRHLDLDWDVLLDQKILKGAVTLTLERLVQDSTQLVLDTRDLKIHKAEVSGGDSFTATEFSLGQTDKILGTPLSIQLPKHTTKIRVEYSTSPGASGLQWLDPPQTAGKKHAFMYTQSQAIHARSWIPLQDTPQVRVTYNATVRVPRGLLAVMSAENDPRVSNDGVYRFKMTQAIPSYLVALAVGDLTFKSLGTRTGVYAEKPVIDKAAFEFADVEKMVVATEKLYGPYRWGRYDVLVLPPSFPLGGMENPRLTFATPTILAGDRSLVSLIAHELAHSWSGNLVTNATWRDFWLNEGFTVYLERRIIEEVYGRAREEMEAVLGLQTLREEIDRLEDRDEILHVDLKGRDPDDGFTQVPYEKGALFLRHIEETVGRKDFDQFLRGYFNQYAFQSITTQEFLAYLQKNLLSRIPAKAASIPLDDWVRKPGIPSGAPSPGSPAFSQVEKHADQWLQAKIDASKIDTSKWTTHEWLHFLKYVSKDLGAERMKELDETFRLTQSGNSEIQHEWLLLAIRNRYEAAYPRLESYLISIGRRKLIRPLYEELVKTPEGKTKALSIYQTARPTYHPIAITSIDGILGWK